MRRSSFPLALIVIAAVAAALYAQGVSPGQSPASAAPLGIFTFTGAPEQFVVPVGVDCVRVDVLGAQGGTGENPDDRQAPGGLGGRAVADIAVTPGETLMVYVGGQGGTPEGGFNGGGDGADAEEEAAGGGGGASDIRRAPYGLADRLVVAGGGGGGGADARANSEGGAGGGLVGEDGNGSYSDIPTPGGGGGTQAAGGSAPTAFDGTATSGMLGEGGEGGIGPSNDDGGGGGGGGYYGGGGGAGEDDDVPTDGGGGGGGGSGFGPPDTVFTTGFQGGNGAVEINPCPATLTVLKVLPNDDGSTADISDFTLLIDGNPVVHGVPNVLDAGTYLVSETGGPSGFDTTIGSADCDASGSITLSPGQDATCVIVNDDIAPTLTLKKTVINDDGGNAGASSWTLTASGTGGFSGQGTPDATDSVATLGPQAVLANETYTLSESGRPDYIAGAWSCDGGVQAVNSITLAPGDAVTCEIVNDDVSVVPPTITVAKVMNNDDGGTANASDFTLLLDGTPIADGMPRAVTVGTHTVSETGGPPGYTATFDLACDASGSVTVSAGQNVTCRITNDDIAPTLTLKKTVINDSGGAAGASNWTLTASGTGGFSGTGTPDATDSMATLGPQAVRANETYTLSESGPTYGAGAWSCDGGVQAANTITLAPGDVVTCEIINDDVRVDFDWTVPERFELVDDNGDGLVDYFPPDGNLVIDPGQTTGWQVDFTAGDPAGCDFSLRREWFVDGQSVGFTQLCTFTHYFPSEGVYDVTLEVSDVPGPVVSSITKEVIVQDWLIVSIGDSVASGEGNPDRGAQDGGPTWENGKCHRSAFAGPAQAAADIEQQDPQTSVTFVHLACSGATIVQGLIQSYRGIDPGAPGARPGAQVEQIRQLIPDREIDAIVISIGANDVGFAAIVQSCYIWGDCHTGSGRRLYERRVATLPSAYDALEQHLQSVVGVPGIPSNFIYLTEYFDPTRAFDGSVCPDGTILGDFTFGPGVGPPAFFGLFSVDQVEAEWASNTMLQGLNFVGFDAARRHGWRYVGAIAPAFRGGLGLPGHGYCSQSPWIVRDAESLADQGDHNGTLHPNVAGQTIYGNRISFELTVDFYPRGLQNPPRRPSP